LVNFSADTGVVLCILLITVCDNSMQYGMIVRNVSYITCSARFRNFYQSSN